MGLKALPKGKSTGEIGATADIPYTLVEVAQNDYQRFRATFMAHFPDQEIADTFDEFSRSWPKPGRDEEPTEVAMAALDTWLYKTSDDEQAVQLRDDEAIREWATELGWVPVVFYSIKPITMHENMVLTGWHVEAYVDAEGKRQVRVDGAGMSWDMVRVALQTLRGLHDENGAELKLGFTKEGKPGSRVRLLTQECMDRIPPLLFRELSKAAAGSTTVAQSIKKDVTFGSASQPASKAEVPPAE